MKRKWRAGSRRPAGRRNVLPVEISEETATPFSATPHHSVFFSLLHSTMAFSHYNAHPSSSLFFCSPLFLHPLLISAFQKTNRKVWQAHWYYMLCCKRPLIHSRQRSFSLVQRTGFALQPRVGRSPLEATQHQCMVSAMM